MGPHVDPGHRVTEQEVRKLTDSHRGGRGEGNGKEPDDPDHEAFTRQVEAALPLLAFALERGDSYTMLLIIVIVLAIRAAADDRRRGGS
jgi:hypothetical protein